MIKPKMPALPKLPKLPPLPALPAAPGAKPKADKPIDESLAELLDQEVKRYDGAFDKLRSDIKAEQHRFEIVNDSEYWIAVCFETRQQKEEFLALHGLSDLGDKYIDGLAASRRLGKPLTSPRPKWPNHRQNRNWMKFR